MSLVTERNATSLASSTFTALEVKNDMPALYGLSPVAKQLVSLLVTQPELLYRYSQDPKGVITTCQLQLGEIPVRDLATLDMAYQLFVAPIIISGAPPSNPLNGAWYDPNH